MSAPENLNERQFKTPPKQRIVYSEPKGQRTRKGVPSVSTLECGHAAETHARDRAKGSATCFDCFYGKPKDSVSEDILNGSMGVKLPDWYQPDSGGR